jgi:hypothetical protein
VHRLQGHEQQPLPGHEVRGQPGVVREQDGAVRRAAEQPHRPSKHADAGVQVDDRLDPQAGVPLPAQVHGHRDRLRRHPDGAAAGGHEGHPVVHRLP